MPQPGDEALDQHTLNIELWGDVLIVLGAAVAIVAAFHRFAMGPLLGYFAAGFVIGPNVLGLVAAGGAMAAIAEIGVVFLLFAVGLELPLRRLWVMRRWLFGLGLGQVALTSLLIALGMAALGHGAAPAIVVGGALALSSTAVGLQILVERGELATRHGRAAFAILLVQDLAVVPLLVLLPLLGAGGGDFARALGLAGIEAVLVLVGLALFGRYALGPVLHLVARTRSAELFVAAALVLVLGAGLATAATGLSMALGGFLAGMLLADSEFRHQIDADIKPFRGLLLGLFFMTVGMTIDPAVVADRVVVIVGLVAVLALGKGAVVALLARGFGLSWVEAVRAGLVLGHAGEFAFVILTLAAQVGVLDGAAAQTLIVAAALSMAVCPLLDRAGHAWAGRRGGAQVALDTIAEETSGFSGHVIIAGFGRVGRMVALMLARQGRPWVAIDMDARRVAERRRLGEPVHYGDATRADVLRAAGAERAGAVAVTLDRPELADGAVRALRASWPSLAVIARARDADHARALGLAGARDAVPEAMEAGLRLGVHVLDAVGAEPSVVRETIDALRAEGGSAGVP